MATTQYPTFPAFTFDLGSQLRHAAKASLDEFEASIKRDGHDWLSDYLDNFQAHSRRAPIADLIKTPSRTATAKKTRAVASAAKSRAEQVRKFNTMLSPPMKSPNVGVGAGFRQPFSPLGNNSLNVPMSPTPKSPLAKRSGSSLKPKIVAKVKEPKETKEPKEKEVKQPKAKKTKESKAVKADDAEQSERPATKKRTRSKKKGDASKETSGASTPVESEASSSRHALRSAAVLSPAKRSPSPVKMAVISPASPSPAKKLNFAPSPSSVKTAAKENHPPTPPPKASSRSRGKAVREPEPEPEVVEDQMDLDDEVEEPAPKARPASPLKPASTRAVNRSSPVEGVKEATPKVSSPIRGESPAPISPAKDLSPARTSPVKDKESSPVPVAQAAPAVPVRQVRSSWLSQALGNRTVPMATEGARKSHAPLSASHRTSTQLDYNAIRKSVAAPGTLKRKSEEGPDADADAEPKDADKRADKMARFGDAPATDAISGLPVSPKLQKSVFGSRAPGSATSLPAPAATTPAPLSRPAATSVPDRDRPAGDTYKVTKALEQMRERAATAAAKQQQQRAAGKPVTAPSTGTGFLRGLGHLLGVAPEDEATRAAREIEHRRMQEEAEAELARVLRTMAEGDKPKAVEAEVVEDVEMEMEVETVESKFTKSSKAYAKSSQSESGFEDGNVAIFVEDVDDEDEVNESVSLPELPHLDIGDDYDAHPMDHAGSALGAAGIDIDFGTTTPDNSPPPRVKELKRPAAVRKPTQESVRSPPPRSKTPAHERAKTPAGNKVLAQPVRTRIPERPASREEDDDDEVEDLPKRQRTEKGTRSRFNSTASTSSLASSTTHTKVTSSVLKRAEVMAAKSLGVKPAIGPVKSVQVAEAAAKKAQKAADELKAKKAQEEAKRRVALKAEADRKAEVERERKAEEERVRKAEQEEARKAEEKAERRRAAQQKKMVEAREARMREKEEKMAQAAKEKREREEREEAEAAERRRKLAALNKSQNAGSGGSTIKRVVPAGSQFKPATNRGSNVSTVPAVSSKLGPGTFRTAQPAEERAPTITLVQPSGVHRPLGPPQRTSVQRQSHQAYATSSSHVQASASASTLEASRQTLRAQLDAKALEMASEEIVLPDIASEYSDSDDSDKETDFQRPAWADSPELRSALEAQANVDPDELFGPIRPLNMAELFRQPASKFRARTSSANWVQSGDGLTRREREDYAHRMGFMPLSKDAPGAV